MPVFSLHGSLEYIEETQLQESERKHWRWITPSANYIVPTAFMKGCPYFTPAPWMAWWKNEWDNTNKPWKLSQTKATMYRLLQGNTLISCIISVGPRQLFCPETVSVASKWQGPYLVRGLNNVHSPQELGILMLLLILSNFFLKLCML